MRWVDVTCNVKNLGWPSETTQRVNGTVNTSSKTRFAISTAHSKPSCHVTPMTDTRHTNPTYALGCRFNLPVCILRQVNIVICWHYGGLQSACADSKQPRKSSRHYNCTLYAGTTFERPHEKKYFRRDLLQIVVVNCCKNVGVFFPPASHGKGAWFAEAIIILWITDSNPHILLISPDFQMAILIFELSNSVTTPKWILWFFAEPAVTPASMLTNTNTYSSASAIVFSTLIRFLVLAYAILSHTYANALGFDNIFYRWCIRKQASN